MRRLVLNPSLTPLLTFELLDEVAPATENANDRRVPIPTKPVVQPGPGTYFGPVCTSSTFDVVKNETAPVMVVTALAACEFGRVVPEYFQAHRGVALLDAGCNSLLVLGNVLPALRLEVFPILFTVLAVVRADTGLTPTRSDGALRLVPVLLVEFYTAYGTGLHIILD